MNWVLFKIHSTQNTRHIYNVYIIYTCMQECGKFVFSVFAAVVLSFSLVFFFRCMHGALQGLLSKGDHKVIYSFLQYHGKPNFRLLINLCNICNKTSKEMGPKVPPVACRTKIVPEGGCEHFFFHKSTNSPEVVQRVFDKVLRTKQWSHQWSSPRFGGQCCQLSC